SVRTGAVPGSKIRVIPNGVDVHRFERPSEPRESVRRSYRSEDSFVWVAVGRLMEAKDYGNALEAISRLRGRGSVVLWIAGDGELREQLEQRAEELGVAGQIRFLGF